MAHQKGERVPKDKPFSCCPPVSRTLQEPPPREASAQAAVGTSLIPLVVPWSRMQNAIPVASWGVEVESVVGGRCFGESRWTRLTPPEDDRKIKHPHFGEGLGEKPIGCKRLRHHI